ncbi:MAG: hypothetical protein D6737_07115 [Chloroflexi bacterium]|nr:MAG: hypothetical protein D6737_07115 [Chloroflexota bacterium]
MFRNRLSYLLFIIPLIAVGILIAQFVGAQDDVDPLVQQRLGLINFRPIEDVIDDEFVVQNFTSDGFASLPFETQIPLACTIVWGDAPDNFTELSLDLDMNGGTHSVHNPQLRNLEPETTYYFRVQGVADDGTMYLSDVMEFTTPDFAVEVETQAESENVNLISLENGAQIVGVSSNFGGQDNDGTWGIFSALDGNPRTAWSSAGDGDDAWFEVELAQRSHIERVEFWTRFMSDGTARITSFRVIADDGEVLGPFELPDADQSYSFDVDIEATTLRFEVESSTGGNTGAVEVAVYGTPVE